MKVGISIKRDLLNLIRRHVFHLENESSLWNEVFGIDYTRGCLELITLVFVFVTKPSKTTTHGLREILDYTGKIFESAGALCHEKSVSLFFLKIFMLRNSALRRKYFIKDFLHLKISFRIDYIHFHMWCPFFVCLTMTAS